VPDAAVALLLPSETGHGTGSMFILLAQDVNQGKLMDEILGVLVALVIIIYYPFWHFDVAPFSDEKIAYRQFQSCTDRSYGETCHWQNLPLRTFRIDYSGQIVVEQEVVDDTPMALRECVVFDRNNWKCRSDHDWPTSAVGFSGGNYIAPASGAIREVSKLKWWINRAKSR